MRVLWFTGTETSKQNKGFYGGGGWISSLREMVLKNTEIELAEAFLYDVVEKPRFQNGCMQYPMYKKPRNRFQKFYYNWFGYQKLPFSIDVPEMLRVVNDFKPDVIHVFGIETTFPAIQNYTDIPVLIYIQGLLNPYRNAFFPPGINKWSFLFTGLSKNEWVLHNGFIFNSKNMSYNARREMEFFKDSKYLIGRTKWDNEISNLLAPQSQYFFLNEMMRSEFYSAPAWNKKREGRFIIYTTISNVSYKGIDLVLKTAKLLKEHSQLDFEWQVAGLNSNSALISFFEKILGIKSNAVNVIYKGVVCCNQLVDDLLSSDVLMHPSYIDNSPNSVCEAQLLGLPVIACYVGGVTTLIKNGETGILVPSNSPYELASILIKSANTDNLRFLSSKARNAALDRHDKNKILSDLVEIYNTVLDN